MPEKNLKQNNDFISGWLGRANNKGLKSAINDYKDAGGTVISADKGDGIPYKPTFGEKFFPKAENANPEHINLKVPFTKDRYLDLSGGTQNAKPSVLANPQVFGGEKNVPGAFSFLFNTPSIALQFPTRGAVTGYEEVKSAINGGKPEEKTLGNIEGALYGEDKYQNVGKMAEVFQREGNPLTPGLQYDTASSLIEAAGWKLLDVGAGAGAIARSLGVLSNSLAEGSQFSKIAAWKTLGSPRNLEEASQNYRKLVQQFTTDPKNPGGGNPLGYQVINDARKIIDKEGVPQVSDLARAKAAEYTDWASRQSKLSFKEPGKIFEPDLKLRPQTQPKALNVPALPGTRAADENQFPLGLSTEKREPVGYSKEKGDLQARAVAVADDLSRGAITEEVAATQLETIKQELKALDKQPVYEGETNAKTHLVKAKAALTEAKGLSASDIMAKHPDIQLKRDVQAKDIHGNKVVIPEGEALTPYELKGNKVLLQDGVTYIVSKNQYQNIKGNAISGEAKEFAPELKGLEQGTTFKEAVSNAGNQEIAEWFGGEQVVDDLKDVPSEQQAIKITPEIKALVKGEAPFIKPEMKDPMTANKRYRYMTGGPKALNEEVESYIRELAQKEGFDDKNLDVIFKEGFRKDTSLWGEAESYYDVLSGEMKHVITLDTKGGTSRPRIAGHELKHVLMNIMEDGKYEALQTEALSKMDEGDFRRYEKQGYEGRISQVNEFIADEYGKFRADEAGYKGKIQKVLEAIKAAINKAVDFAKEIFNKAKSEFEAVPNKEGGFIKNPISTEEEVARAVIKRKELQLQLRSALKEEMPKIIEEINALTRVISEARTNKLKAANNVPEVKPEPVKNETPEEIGIIQSNYQDTEAALKEMSKLEEKARGKIKSLDLVEAEKELDGMQQQLTIAKEAYDQSPVRQLVKYVASRGNFGGTISDKTFEKLDNGIAQEAGFKDIDELRDAIEKDRMQKQSIYEMEQNLKEHKLHLRELKDKEAAEISLGKFLNKQQVKTSKEIIEKDRVKRLEKAQKEAAQRIADEQLAKAKFKKTVLDAQVNKNTKGGLYQKLKETFKPIEGLDAETQKIFKTWKTRQLVAKQLANEEFRGVAKKYPQVKDGLDTMIAYQAGMPVPWIKEPLDALFSEAKRRGLDFSYRDNYLPQVYENTSEEIKAALGKYLLDAGVEKAIAEQYLKGAQELPEEISNRLKLNPSFTKTRVFPNYMVAMEYGLKPKYTNALQLIGYYREEMEKTLANRDFLDELIKAGKVLPVELTPDHWSPLALPFSPKGYFAEPKLAKVLNGQFRDEENLPLGEYVFKGLAKVNRFTQEIALSGGVPYTTVNFFVFGQLIKEITAGKITSLPAALRANFPNKSIEWFVDNKKYLEMMSSEGISLGDNIANYDNVYQNLSLKWGETFKKAVKNPLDRNARNPFFRMVGETFNEAFNKITFANFMAQLQVQTFKDVYNATLKKGMSVSEASKLAGDTTKTFYGLTGELGRSRFLDDTMGSLFFAPKFREAVINTLVNTGKGVVDLVGSVIKGKKPEPKFKFNRQLFAGMIISYALYNLLNLKLNGNFMWNNEPGKEFDLKLPLPDGNYAYFPFMPSFLALPRNAVSGAIALGKGDVKTTSQKWGSILSMPFKIASEVLSNADYFDRPIYKETDTPATKWRKIATYIGLQPSHPYVKEIVMQMNNPDPLYSSWYQSVSRAMELPFKFSTKDKAEKAMYYEAMDKQAQERARVKEKIQPVYDRVQELLANGKEDEAKSLYQTLSKDDQVIYKNIQTAEKTKKTGSEKSLMYSTVENVQTLIRQGKVEEAQQIIKGMSKEEFRIYKLAKKALGYR